MAIFLGLIGFLLLMSVVAAKFHPGDGRDLLDWDPTERMEKRYAAEFEDMADMLERHNEERRAQGLPEQSEDEYAMEKMREENRWGKPR